MATFSKDALHFFLGNKGGVGKTTAARTNCDGLQAAGVGFAIIECDGGNSDVAKLFGSGSVLDLDQPGGFVALYDAIATAERGKPVVVNTPAGFFERARTHLPAFLDIFPQLSAELQRPVRAIWTIDNKRDSVESLRLFRLSAPGLAVDVIKNEYFGGPNDSFFNETETRKNIESEGGVVVRLPRLADRIAQRMTNERMTHESALTKLDFLSRTEYLRWWTEVTTEFRTAGFLP